ncbi:MAG TPA: hypothetical protein VGV37_08185 [Aliidongia sp.]|uniref:hypothetical protein n=1 Tax=Aliidongia sp. TaxID=1914230 RepID=UPI002DDCB461|nr:hypothetical protein [Aliidongia sp.]HEV2674505.1 hypothetical protein [Aliidongia sp.]
MSEPAASRVAGPERLVLQQVSGRGPFPPHGRRVALLPVRFSLVNAGPMPLTIGSIRLDPLRHDGSGTIVDASLTVAEAVPLDGPFRPGMPLLLDMGGEGPARPGAYSTSLRVLTAEGDALVIPVTLEISAAPAWGVLCMLAGLACVGLINLLATEGAVRNQQSVALAARQQIHAWLEANPAPQSRAGDIEAMNRDFDIAVVTLGERPALSVVDRRSEDAGERLKAADAIADRLRHDLAGRPHGAAEIADLTQDWSDFRDVLQQVAAVNPSPPTPSPAGLAGRLGAFLARYRAYFLEQPVARTSDEMASELNQVRLAYAAGEGDTARDLALNARRRLRRSARALNAALTGYRGALVRTDAMLTTDRVVRARVARDDFPVAARTQILAMLDGAANGMGSTAGLAEWGAASQQIDAAKTALVRATKENLETRFTAALAAVSAKSGTDDIEQLVETLQAATDHSTAAKQAGLSRVLDLWRVHIADVTDEGLRKKLSASVDAIATLVAKGDLPATSPLYRTLTNDWIIWETRLINDAKNRFDHDQCVDLFVDLQNDTGAIEARLGVLPPEPRLEDWEIGLAKIRHDMQRQAPDAEIITEDCMTPLLALNQRVIDLSGEILAVTIVDLDVPARTRDRLAHASGMPAVAAATAAENIQSRRIDLTPVTPPEERIAGRPLTFTVGHMDPAWEMDVSIGVDFGDGSPPLVATAEQVRQGLPIIHEYGAPLTLHPSVVAAENFKPGGMEPREAPLGEGGTTLLIAPSPVSDAARLADDFLNLRFAIALLIALVVYHWRYHSRTAIFGARSFDYVEAFALGFAANVAVSKLPEILAKIVSP